MELIYARWLLWGARLGLAALTLAFLAYVGGLATPLVPLEALPRLWRLPLADFLAESGAPTGWGWVALVGKGDYASLAGIALLCLVSLACYLRLLAALWRQGERALAAVAGAQIAVFVAAALGVFTGGG